MSPTTALAAPPPAPQAVPDLLARAHVTEIFDGVRLAVIPRVAVDFDYFMGNSPWRSVGLDGTVKGPPRWDLATKRFVFNHHDDVQRWVTKTTGDQARDSLDHGLLDHLMDEDGCNFYVFKNDADPDITLGGYQICYASEGLANPTPQLRRLLFLNSQLDISGATFGPKTYTMLMRQGAWIFEPYYKALGSGLYDMDGAAMTAVILEQYERIKQYLLGNGRRAAVRAGKITLHDGSAWAMIKEQGPFGRLRAFQERNIDGLVVFKSESAAGFRYTAVARSHLAPFPVPVLDDYLNRVDSLIRAGAEPTLRDLMASKKDGARAELWKLLSTADLTIKPWGGGDLIIGSLRDFGSMITPAFMPLVMDTFSREIAPVAVARGARTLAGTFGVGEVELAGAVLPAVPV